MKIYGITKDFKVVTVSLGSAEMMACIEVAMSRDEAVIRAKELEAMLKRGAGDE